MINTRFTSRLFSIIVFGEVDSGCFRNPCDVCGHLCIYRVVKSEPTNW